MATKMILETKMVVSMLLLLFFSTNKIIPVNTKKKQYNKIKYNLKNNKTKNTSVSEPKRRGQDGCCHASFEL